jgi:hypothetical protein
MEEAIENQPYCESATVGIRTDCLGVDIEHGYPLVELDAVRTNVSPPIPGRRVSLSRSGVRLIPLPTNPGV